MTSLLLENIDVEKLEFIVQDDSRESFQRPAR